MGLKNQQQLCDAKAHIGADGITEETYGDTWTDDGLVAQGASHDRCEGRRADERYAGGDRRICIDAEDGTQQYVEQQRAEGGNGDEEENVRVDIGECLQTHLRGYWKELGKKVTNEPKNPNGLFCQSLYDESSPYFAKT